MIDVSTVEEIKMLVKEQAEEIKSLAEQSLDTVIAAHAAEKRISVFDVACISLPMGRL
jgi:hypothetical protein